MTTSSTESVINLQSSASTHYHPLQSPFMPYSRVCLKYMKEANRVKIDLIVIGNPNSGKTSLIRRFIEGESNIHSTKPPSPSSILPLSGSVSTRRSSNSTAMRSPSAFGTPPASKSSSHSPRTTSKRQMASSLSSTSLTNQASTVTLLSRRSR